ncbi:MAG: type VI secretion system baseplate subunit TssG [Gammaproteobacteria bacterium]|nr:type VI secretion system baseplate subunit TssG [Gammaproteobacteria bacterium]MDH5692164.1 type VI secretion system baseplate subunit TssG [Gammaproteobacteria bacterium]
MEADERPASAVVAEGLEKRAAAYNFFQAVQLILRTNPGRKQPGEKGPFSKEVVRFRANASLGFPRGDIERVEEQRHPGFPPFMMDVNFLGIYGPSSPLPSFYTEDLLGKSDEENPARHFLDLFHHRFISFYYRSWHKYRYSLHFQKRGRDAFSKNLLSLIGLHDDKVIAGLDLDRDRLVPLVGLMIAPARSKETLEKVISAYFGGISVEIQQFVAERVTIDRSQRNAIGLENCFLGKDVLLGKNVTTITDSIQVLVGPVGYADYMQFLPGKRAHRALRSLVTLLCKDAISYSFKMKIKTDAVPKLKISKNNDCGLGWNTWLGIPKVNEFTVSQAGQ